MTEYYLPPPPPEGMPQGFQGVVRDDGAWIPPDPANRDWAEYQVWRADGNKPKLYDQMPQPQPPPET